MNTQITELIELVHNSDFTDDQIDAIKERLRLAEIEFNKQKPIDLEVKYTL